MSVFTDKWIEEHKAELVSVLQQTIQYNTVKDKASAETGAPLGKELKKCLDFILGTAENMGFSTKNFDGYVGGIDCGQGEEQLGILAHLDIVPAGNGWNYPPFSGEIHDGCLWGRGAVDDKGPAVAALFALAAVKESGLKFRRRVRIILGCDEECDMECLKHYRQVEKLPDLAFSPDADYPLINSEKMIYGAEYGSMFSSRISIKGGTASNAVADECTILLPLEKKAVQEAIDTIERNDFRFSIQETEKTCTVKILGVAAHASSPFKGKNAIYAALDLVSHLPLGKDAEVAQALSSLLRYDYHGEMFGIDAEDASGRLTINCGVIDWDESGIRRLTVDIRAPITSDADQITEKLREGFKPSGCAELNHHYSNGYYIPEDSEIVSTLMEIYRKHFDTDAKPMAIGGGTYARYLSNAVAFGPERKGDAAGVHMANERVRIDYLIEDAKVYADAIIALACDS